jgi:hypothetical protein
MKCLGTLACAAAVLAVSCAPVAREAEMTVVLPAPPERWGRAFSDLGFELVYWDEAGVEHRMDVPGVGTAEIPCPRQANSAVLAYPVCRSDVSGLLRPAGALFPRNTEDGTSLGLTWEDGPLALLISLLSSLGRDPSLFNAARLAEYFAREPDPWALDIAAMAQKIADGTFSAYDVDLLPCREVSFAAGTGEWFFESPFSTVVTADESGTVTVPALAFGMHGLFSVDGRALRIYVGQRETVATAP